MTDTSKEAPGASPQSEQSEQSAPSVLRVMFVVIVFAVTWLVWSGIFKPLLLGFGAASVLAVTWVALRSGFFARDVYSLNLLRGLFGFWAWLLVEVAKSNVSVARMVLTNRMDSEPVVIELDVSELSPVKQAILANSVTLTPGTLTLDLHGGVLEVHCLSRYFADDLESSGMLERVRDLPGD